MKQSILTTLITDLFASLLIELIVLFSEQSIGPFVASTLLIFFSSFIPILIAVLLFQLYLKKHFDTLPWKISQIIKISLLFIIIQMALIIWSTFDVFVYSWTFKALTFNNILNDYKQEFLGKIALISLVAVVIPIVDLTLVKKNIFT